MPTYDVPGVYIEEQTGPGVITGVGTSTAAFIGPALRGQIIEARRISSFDEFLENFGVTKSDGRLWPYITEPHHFYMAHAVRGFFQNGGRQAYIVRAGTGRRASLPVNNQAGENVFNIEAQQEGVAGNNIQIETQLAAKHWIAVGSAQVTAIDGAGTGITVDDASPFSVGDIIAENVAGAPSETITDIQGNVITINAPLAGLAINDILRIADITPTHTSFRLNKIDGFYSGGMILIEGNDTGGNPVSDRLKVQSVDATTCFITLDPATPITNTYDLNVALANAPTLTSIRTIAIASTTVASINGTDVSVNDASSFRVGDIVTEDNVARATINKIQGNTLTLDSALPGLNVGDTLRIANFPPAQTSIRVTDVTGLYPGGVLLISGDDANNPGNTVTDYAIIESADPMGFVTLRNSPARTNTYNLAVTEANAPTLTPQEFRLIITLPAASGRPDGRINNLSIDPYHPRYIFNETVLNEIADFDATQKWVRILQPDQPPITINFPGRLVSIVGSTPLAGGQDDQPNALTSVHYQDGLKVLKDVDDVNLICVPDAASHPECQTIQQAMINHCLLSQLQDRFAILDSIPNIPPSGPGSVEEQRQHVQSDRGFAALYYPWIEVRDPSSTGPLPRTIFIPPSGHIAGVYARTDGEVGVHKAPANTTVRGILGLERRLSDGQHGPLNLAGVNVLRIFPGSAQITVWGARTTIDPNITDWLYVNVRRLMLYIEESIEEGIRWAVFEPNNLALWQKLKRTINDFLTRVWRDGALFGDTPDKAFYVRIDEALNPPSTRAIGRLYIEIGVAPVRPAEFIIVRIGLWDGGSEVTEAQ